MNLEEMKILITSLLNFTSLQKRALLSVTSLRATFRKETMSMMLDELIECHVVNNDDQISSFYGLVAKCNTLLHTFFYFLVYLSSIFFVFDEEKKQKT